MPEIPASSSAHLLHRVGLVLADEGIPWAAIGALAVAYHGWVRASIDADALITLRGSEKELDHLTKTLRSQGWKVDARVGDEDDPLGFVVRIMDDEGNQVDLIGGIRRLDPGFFDRIIPADFEGLKLYFSSPEDLIALKVFAGGPKDLEDAAGVLEVLGSAIDKDLLFGLCRRFGAQAEMECAKLYSNLGKS